jgi:hypothetical protein
MASLWHEIGHAKPSLATQQKMSATVKCFAITRFDSIRGKRETIVTTKSFVIAKPEQVINYLLLCFVVRIIARSFGKVNPFYESFIYVYGDTNLWR